MSASLRLAAILLALPPAGAAIASAADRSPTPGDRIPTDQGDLLIYPIQHASFVMQWSRITIAVDPVGGGDAFQAFPRADLVLITHDHRDHLDPATIRAVAAEDAAIVAPEAVKQQLPQPLAARTTVLANGEKTRAKGAAIKATPMYNLTPERAKFHPRGRGNGYVLTLGNVRIYISGDTEAIPEMLRLRDIDAAFLCMNLPYTMDVQAAARAVRQFRPKIVYPYHYRCAGGVMSDLEQFRRLVGADSGVQVRVLNWYPQRARP